MVETGHVPRVALLARAGAACERIDEALRLAGAEVVLVADPQQADPAQVRAAMPEAILVALDPAIEDAIERYEDVLADPAYLVIFEEAEQAAQRTGWDAARWLRHLSAKLHRHQNVLPAGAGVEEDLHPVPGPMPTRPVQLDYDEAIVAFTDEAQELADEVPSDSGLDGLSGTEERSLEPPTLEALVRSLQGDSLDAPSLAGLNLELDEPTLTLDDPGLSIAEGIALVDDGGGLSIEAEALSLADFILEAGGHLELEPVSDADTAEAAGMRFDPIAMSAGDGDGSMDDIDYDPERFSRLGQVDDVPAGIEEFLAAQIQLAPIEADAEAPAPAAAAPRAEIGVDHFDFSGLSLADDDAGPLPTDKPKPPAFNLDAIGAGLSLADPDSYGHGPLRGLVLIEAGLGGPDAVRQLLAAMPDALPRPILIHLPLEGGRYDRLVKQMTRATSAPVAVAISGQAAEPGSIYFVPPELGLRAAGGSWTFDALVAFDPQILPADDSAVLVLSGADALRVAGLIDGSWAGLVLGQTPDEGCYDPAGAQAAIAAGAGHGTPVELAEKLIQRWSASAAASNDDPGGMLQL